MTPIDEPASFAKPAPKTPKAEAPSPAQPSKADLVAFTIEAATGRLIKVEAADASGSRKELSDSEWRSFTRAGAEATLENIVEQAFEAGIACVLGDAPREDDPPQSDEDADLSRALLRSLIERSAARRLMEGDVLSRAIVGTLIARGARAPDATPDASAPH